MLGPCETLGFFTQLQVGVNNPTLQKWVDSTCQALNPFWVEGGGSKVLTLLVGGDVWQEQARHLHLPVAAC